MCVYLNCKVCGSPIKGIGDYCIRTAHTECGGSFDKPDSKDVLIDRLKKRGEYSGLTKLKFKE